MELVRDGNAKLAAYALLAGTIGILVKSTQGMNALELVFFRAAVASLFILGVAVLQKRLGELSPAYPRETIMLAVFQALNIGLYFAALQQTSVSNAVFLLYTAPVFSAILAAVFLKEKVEKETVLAILATTTGITLILDPSSFSFNPVQTTGNLLALGAGLSYAAMTVAAKPVLEKVSGHYIVFWQYTLISLAGLLFINPSVLPAAFANWWQLLALGIFCTAIAYMLFMEGVKTVKAQRVLVITTLEPLTGSILAIFVLNEIPTPLGLAGALMIIYGVWAITHGKRKEEKKEK